MNYYQCCISNILLIFVLLLFYGNKNELVLSKCVEFVYMQYYEILIEGMLVFS